MEKRSTLNKVCLWLILLVASIGVLLTFSNALAIFWTLGINRNPLIPGDILKVGLFPNFILFLLFGALLFLGIRLIKGRPKHPYRTVILFVAMTLLCLRYPHVFMFLSEINPLIE